MKDTLGKKYANKVFSWRGGGFRAAQADVEYHQSRECFEEDCRANLWTFLKNGEMFD